jgi:hypothetical protein
MTAECLIRAVILATGLTLGPAAAGADPALEAWLSEKDALARRGSMRVDARVSGIQLIDPRPLGPVEVLDVTVPAELDPDA